MCVPFHRLPTRLMLDRVLFAMWIAATFAQGHASAQNQVAAKAVATNTPAADRSLSTIRCWSRRSIPAPGRRIRFRGFRSRISGRSARDSAVQHRRAADRRQHRHANGRAAAFRGAARAEAGEIGTARPGVHRQDRGLAVRRRSLRGRCARPAGPGAQGRQPAWSRPKHVERFEQQHRPVRFGDVVLFRSDYSDKYYRPFPEGNRFIADVLDRKAPGFPDPDPDCMEFLGDARRDDAGHRQRQHGAAAGPGRADALRRPEARHDLDRRRDEPRRAAGDRRVSTACSVRSMQGGPYAEARAFSIVGGELPQRLIESCEEQAGDRSFADACRRICR